MERRPRSPPGHVFVVHIHQDATDALLPTKWHGKVQNLTTGEIRTFRGWADLVQRMQDLMT